jgi:hypothetical protein
MEVGWVDRRKRRNLKYRGVSWPGSGYGLGVGRGRKRGGRMGREGFLYKLGRGAIVWFM